MNSYPFILIITGFLIALWAYACFSKLLALHKFKKALMVQVFPKWVGKILLVMLPLTELALIALLWMPETRLLGMLLSLFLLLAFTIYIAGAVFQVYDRYPCACGGIFGRIGWYKHFRVNVMLTLIALIGVILMRL